jgi:chromosome segregation ATPase
MSASYTVTPDGGVDLVNERGTLSLTRHQLAVIYLLGKQEQEAREKRNDGIDAAVEAASIEIDQLRAQLAVERGANSSLKLEVDKYRELEQARGQGYDAIREVMTLKGQLIDLERQKAILMESNGRTQGDCRKMMEEMVIVKDELAAHKEQLRIAHINLDAARSELRRLTKELQQERDAHAATRLLLGALQEVAESWKDFKKRIDSIWQR